MGKLSIKKILSAMTAMVLSSQANAADPAAAPPYSAPAPVVAEVFNWTGFYAGANVGYGFSGSGDGVRFIDSAGQTQGTISLARKGVIGGAEAGFNWQTGALVLGVEGDFSDVNGRNRGTFVFPLMGIINIFPSIATASSSLDWLTTVRGRIGFTPADRLLVFGTGGVAFGQVNNQVSINQLGPVELGGSDRSTRTGWVAGAGAQYALTNDLFAKMEWLHYDLGTDTPACNIFNFISRSPICADSSHFKTSGDIVRLGVDYRFGGPLAARY